MILKMIVVVVCYLLIIAWCVCVLTVFSLWSKLGKIRRIKENLKGKDDEK